MFLRILQNRFLFFIVSSVYTESLGSVELRYNLCSENVTCDARAFGSNSSFQVGQVKTGTVLYNVDRPDVRQIVVQCISKQPLRWVLGPLGNREAIKSESWVTSELEYHYKVTFGANQASPSTGLVRCEGYLNKTDVAEVYFALDLSYRDPQLPVVYLHATDRYHVDDYDSNQGDEVIPCETLGFDRKFPFQNVKLLKAPKSEMMLKSKAPHPSDACLHCLCQAPGSSCKNPNACEGDRCGPYGISKALWEDAGRPKLKLAVMRNTSEVDEWKKCVTNQTCAIQVLKNLTKVAPECLKEPVLTCSSFYSALQAYPQPCSWSDSIKDQSTFDAIEQCLLNLHEDHRVDIADAQGYDPRIGFRLRPGYFDYDSVYICPKIYKQRPIYFVPINPANRINSSLELRSIDSANKLSGLTCIVPDKDMEGVQLQMIPCATIDSCDLFMRNFGSRKYLIDTPLKVHGGRISKLYPSSELYGRIIQSVPSQGIVVCAATFENSYIRHYEHIFTGLDSRMYFVLASFPVQATVQLVKVKDSKDTFNCKISTFVNFPSISFSIKMTNGTDRLVRDGAAGVKLSVLRTGEYMAERNITVAGIEDVMEITCYVPSRISDRLEAVSVILSYRRDMYKILALISLMGLFIIALLAAAL